MDKLPDCQHQFETEPECAPALLKSYHCPKCDVKWTDIWSCDCDDKCPGCGRDYTPIRSIEIGPCACRFFKNQQVLHNYIGGPHGNQ